ncbi:hypothetical protein ACHAW6_013375 [Cyclotella cf. meneghiniana]
MATTVSHSPGTEPPNYSIKRKKVQDIFLKVYDIHETVFKDLTGQFPTQSQSSNKYIMVMVNIDSSGILVEPIKTAVMPNSNAPMAC